MNRNELIDAVAESSGESKSTVDKVLSAFDATLVDAVGKGEEVKMTGLFTSLSSSAPAGSPPPATVSHHGTMASYMTRLSAHVSAARKNPLTYAVSSSPHGNGSQKPPSAVAMQPFAVVCMWTTSFLMVMPPVPRRRSSPIAR